MSRRGDNEVRVRPGAPRNRGQSFVSRVLKQVGKAGGQSAVRWPARVAGRSQRGGRRPGARLGRGHTAARFAVIAAASVGIFFFFFPAQLLGIFGMHEPAVISIGSQLLRVLSVSGMFIGVALTYTGGLQGTGDTKSPLYISIVSNLVIPLGICFVIRETGTLHPIHIWLAILTGHATRCALSVLRFNQGKWRGIAVDIGPPARS